MQKRCVAKAMQGKSLVEVLEAEHPDALADLNAIREVFGAVTILSSEVVLDGEKWTDRMEKLCERSASD